MLKKCPTIFFWINSYSPSMSRWYANAMDEEGVLYGSATAPYAPQAYQQLLFTTVQRLWAAFPRGFDIEMLPLDEPVSKHAGLSAAVEKHKARAPKAETLSDDEIMEGSDDGIDGQGDGA